MNCNIFFFQSYLKIVYFRNITYLKHLTDWYVFPSSPGIPKLESRNRFYRERKSSLYNHVKSCLNMKNVNFLLILKSKVFIFYCIMADTWCHWNMFILDFIGLLLLRKHLNSVFAKVSYLCAGILSDNSFSFILAIVIFEK